MNLTTFDLNLLVVFEAILRERSVTKAGERLGLSQPAMSHALNRLRYMLKDQLFVRTPDGMTPTARADQLAEPIRRALGDLRAALDPEEFIPAQAERRFTIAVNNYAAVVLAGPIAAECAASAPHVRLYMRPSGTLDLADQLDRGDLDLAITSFAPTADRFGSRMLVEDDYVAVMRNNHPALLESFDMPAFAMLSHLVVSSSGEDLGFIDDALSVQGYARIVGAEAPYLSSGTILVTSDMVAVLGRELAKQFKAAYSIEFRDLPFVPPRLRSVMSWHKRSTDQPALRWLRGTIARVAAKL